MNGRLPRVCVTGATGYLGQRVLAGLRDMGIPAVACPSRREGCDLTHLQSVIDYFSRENFTAVIHCAAVVPKSAKDYADGAAGAASLRMTENIVAAGVPHVVFTSSMTVYRDGLLLPVREDDADQEAKGYGGYKLQAERALCAADHLKTTILRLPGLFGPPRESGLLYNAAIEFSKGRLPALRPPFPMWAAMHIDDAADLLCRAVRRPPANSRVLNAGYLDSMSVTRTVSQLAAKFGIDMPEGEARAFRMDVTELEKELGSPLNTLDARLDELARSVRRAEEPVCA